MSSSSSFSFSFYFSISFRRLSKYLPILRWSDKVREKLNYKLTRDECQNVHRFSHADILAKYMNEDSTAVESYKSFEEAWNAFYQDCDTQQKFIQFDRNIIPDCQDLELIRMNERTVPISYSCCYHKDEFRSIPYLLHHLGKIQNDFLSEYDNRQSQEKATIRPVRYLQKVKGTELILIDDQLIEKVVLRDFTNNHYQLMKGKEIQCNWKEIENFLYPLLVLGKSIFYLKVEENQEVQIKSMNNNNNSKPSDKPLFIQQQTFEFFHFKFEGFAKNSNVLIGLSDFVAQKKIDFNAIRHDYYSLYAHEMELQFQLYPLLESILSLLKYQPRGISADMTLMDFSKLYLDANMVALLTKYQEKNYLIPSFTLSEIESFYEYVEDLLHDSIFRGMKPAYKAELQITNDAINVKEVIALLCEKVGGISILENCIFRFIVRYLHGQQSVSFSIPSTESFATYSDLVQWPKDLEMYFILMDNPILELFFQELPIGQLFAFRELLLKEMQSNGHSDPHQIKNRITVMTSAASAGGGGFSSSSSGGAGSLGGGGGGGASRRRGVQRSKFE
jgi:uncharacterized membrane protein YgcG